MLQGTDHKNAITSSNLAEVLLRGSYNGSQSIVSVAMGIVSEKKCVQHPNLRTYLDSTFSRSAMSGSNESQFERFP